MEEVQFPDVIELNVGGKLMTTLLSTLTKDPESMLAAMFNGRHVINKDKDGRYFIDCDGNLFRYILNFLRFGTLPPNEKALEIHDIASYFNITSLVKALEDCQAVQFRKRIEEMKGNIDLREYESTKREAIEKLYISNARQQDGKLLCIYKNNPCFSGSHCSVENMHCQLLGYNSKIRISLATNYKTNEEFRICLAHDLCELGFGIFSHISTENQRLLVQCTMCGNYMHVDYIMLLTQKSMQLLDTKEKLFYPA